MNGLRILLFLIVSCCAADAMASELRVLFFTMDGCPPCDRTEPSIDRLGQSGTAISKIDVRQYADYAAQCQVTQTPTIILVDGNQVLARHTGALTWDELNRMVASHRPAATVATSAPTPAVAANASPDPRQLAYQATVRLRVDDGQGTSHATGTVIHRVEQEALVVTCGHVFRDSRGKGKINVDLGFERGEPLTVTGNLVSWDADNHDIALVAIPCPLPIQPMPVARPDLAINTGTPVFSLGCDHGQPPTERSSVLKAITRYSGINKYDIVGRPVDGRSGGGLFTDDGQLVGVCNAAAVEVDEGIYTGLQSVWWQLNHANLAHLFPSPATATPAAQVAGSNGTSPPPSRLASVSGEALHNPPVRTGEARPDEQTPVNQPAVFRGGGVPVRTAGHPATRGSMEMIVVIRSVDDPGQTRTITIANPDQHLLKMLDQAGSGSLDQPSPPARMAALPDLQPSTGADSGGMRAQSPR